MYNREDRRPHQLQIKYDRETRRAQKSRVPRKHELFSGKGKCTSDSPKNQRRLTSKKSKIGPRYHLLIFFSFFPLFQVHVELMLDNIIFWPSEKFTNSPSRLGSNQFPLRKCWRLGSCHMKNCSGISKPAMTYMRG